MPTRPPLHRLKPSPMPRHSLRVERLRGRKAVAQRLRRLRNEPLCRHCLASGRVTAATEVDHVIPLHKGGSDTDGNCQSLCGPCHRAKTAEDCR